MKNKMTKRDFNRMVAPMIENSNWKNRKTGLAQSAYCGTVLPIFIVGEMKIQAVNEQAAQDKYNKIISKRNRKQKQ